MTRSHHFILESVVDVDNESSELYRRLGFTVFGTRARYEDKTVDASVKA